MFLTLVGGLILCLVAGVVITAIDRLVTRTPTPGEVVKMHKKSAGNSGFVWTHTDSPPAYGERGEVSTVDSKTLSHMNVPAPRLSVVAIEDAKAPPPWAAAGKAWQSTEERQANNPAAWAYSDVEFEVTQ